MPTDGRFDHLCVGALHAELAPGALEASSPFLSLFQSRFQLHGCWAATAAHHAALRCLPSSRPPSDHACANFIEFFGAIYMNEHTENLSKRLCGGVGRARALPPRYEYCSW